MAKLDKSAVQGAHQRLAKAKEAYFLADEALQATPEYKAAQHAKQELELAEDCLAGIQMLLNVKVV
jgi:hypothetical protein